jgi:4-hydroxy-4-methyl-2-oxoglutarate aldolase
MKLTAEMVEVANGRAEWHFQSHRRYGNGIRNRGKQDPEFCMSVSAAPSDITMDMMRRELYSAVVSDALDALGFPRQSPRLPLLRYAGEGLLVGRCKTTLWTDMAHVDPQPYELELRAVDSCQPDDVLIAAAGGSMRSGIWGELLTTAAKNTGCIGAVVDGAVRDVAKIRRIGFNLLARGTCVYDSQNRQRVVDLDVAVEIDSVAFHPGDLVFADEDGVVVVPRKVEREAIQRAWRKVHEENITRDAIKAGLKSAEAYAKYGVL